MDINKAMGFLGLCRRAGKLCCGHDAVTETVVKNKAKLIVLASDASERLVSEMEHSALYGGKNIPVVKSSFSMQQFFDGIGKKSAVFSITDSGFSEKLRIMFGEEKNDK